MEVKMDIDKIEYGETVSVRLENYDKFSDFIQQTFQKYLNGELPPVTTEETKRALELWFSKKHSNNGDENECKSSTDNVTFGFEECVPDKRKRIDSILHTT